MRNRHTKFEEVRSVAKKALVLALILIGLARGIWQRQRQELSTSAAHIDLPFAITENAEERGLAVQHQALNIPYEHENIMPIINSIGANVSVVDINNDGFMDVFMNHNKLGQPAQLFVNDGKGHFKEDAAHFGLDIAETMRAAWRSAFFDCDNDGRTDLFWGTSTCHEIYRQGSDGRFRREENPGFTDCDLGHAIAIEDINNDDHLDVIIGGFAQDVQENPYAVNPLPDSLVNNRRGGRLMAWLNDGQCHFQLSAQDFKEDSLSRSHSIGVGDLRGSGQKDFWVAKDFHQDTVFFKTAGHYSKSEAPQTHSFTGMGSEVFYLEAASQPFLFVSHVFKLGYNVSGNTLWHFEGGRFKDVASERGLKNCGWAWGARAIDLDNDGQLDLAVANGGYEGDGKTDRWFDYSVMFNTYQKITENPKFWPNLNMGNLSGRERDCLFYNQNGTFTDIAAQVNFDPGILSGRAVAVIDPDNSGAQHLLIANQNDKLYYYTIKPNPENKWIGFKLESLRGSREALGAIVTVRAEGKTFRRENYTLNTFAAQNDPRMHFGLGKAAKIEDVEIRWPSGGVEHLGPLPLNRYHHVVEK